KFLTASIWGIGFLSLLVGLAIQLPLMDIDAAVIHYGYRTVRNYQLISYSFLGIGVLLLVGNILKQILKRQEQTKKAQKSSQVLKTPTPMNEQTTIQKLQTMADKEPAYRTELLAAVESIYEMNDCLDDLHELQTNNYYE